VARSSTKGSTNADKPASGRIRRVHPRAPCTRRALYLASILNSGASVLLRLRTGGRDASQPGEMAFVGTRRKGLVVPVDRELEPPLPVALLGRGGPRSVGRRNVACCYRCSQSARSEGRKDILARAGWTPGCVLGKLHGRCADGLQPHSEVVVAVKTRRCGRETVEARTSRQ
jgi:hypothetical protein